MTAVHVVFVHGFKSGPKTWAPLWNQLSKLDGIKNRVTEHRYEYATGLISLKPVAQIPKLEALGEEFATYLETLEGLKPDDTIVLIGHSQGGLVIQSALAHRIDNGRGDELRSIAHCVFIATPTNGSDFIRSVRGFFRRLLPTNWFNQERTLRPLDEFIGKLQRRIAADVVYASAPTPHSHPISITAVFGTADAVVQPQSARWIFPQTEAVAGDHFTVLQPAKPDAPICRIIQEIVVNARYHLPPDGSLVKTIPLCPGDTDLLVKCLDLHHHHFTTSQAIRKEDGEYWLARYETQFGIRLRMIAAVIDNEPRAFLMFHEDAKQDIAVIDYLVGSREDEMDRFAVRKLTDRLQSILKRSGIRRIVFEVARPVSASASHNTDAARIRLFEGQGGRVLSKLDYIAPSMDGTFTKDGEEPSLVMIASVAKPPTSIPWTEVRRIVTYLYGTWYRNWFSHRHSDGLQQMEAYLRDLTTRVLKDVPETGTVALPERYAQ